MIRSLLVRLDAIRARGEARRLAPHLAVGRRAEDLAHRHLESRGLAVIERNYRGGGGEIDLIARDGDRVVFVEVKARTSDDIAAPDRAIDSVKRQALARAAGHYCRKSRIAEHLARFDLVTVVLEHPPRIDHRPDEWALFARNPVS